MFPSVTTCSTSYSTVKVSILKPQSFELPNRSRAHNRPGVQCRDVSYQMLTDNHRWMHISHRNKYLTLSQQRRALLEGQARVCGLLLVLFIMYLCWFVLSEFQTSWFAIIQTWSHLQIQTQNLPVQDRHLTVLQHRHCCFIDC